MKKSVVIVAAVIILFLLIGLAWFLFNKSHKAAQSQQAATQSQGQQMSTQKKSPFDFLSMTGSLKCTFSDKTDNSSGTVYVALGKMRGDFQSIDNGATTNSHMLNDSQFVYFWTDGQKSGYKMSLATMKSQGKEMLGRANSGQSNGSSPQSADMQKQSDYSCGPYAANNTVFTVPTDVTFTDYSAMMQGAMKGVTPQSQGSQGMSSSQKQEECAQCNQVPAGAMRNQCLSSLKCQ